MPQLWMPSAKVWRCLPKVVNPGSILARFKRVFTTSSLFIYNCTHRSIKFWTCNKPCKFENKENLMWHLESLLERKTYKLKEQTILQVQYPPLKLSYYHGLKRKLNPSPLQEDLLHCFVDHLGIHVKPVLRIVFPVYSGDPTKWGKRNYNK